MLRADVGDMQWTMFTHPVKAWIFRTDLYEDMRYGTKVSPRNHGISLAESQHYVIDSTHPCCALNNGIQHWLHVRGGTADDIQHLGCCGLMFQSFAQLSIALLQFLE